MVAGGKLCLSTCNQKFELDIGFKHYGENAIILDFSPLHIDKISDLQVSQNGFIVLGQGRMYLNQETNACREFCKFSINFNHDGSLDTTNLKDDPYEQHLWPGVNVATLK